MARFVRRTGTPGNFTFTPISRAQATGGGTRRRSRSSGFNPSPFRSPEFLEFARTKDAEVGAGIRSLSREAQTVENELRRALPGFAIARDAGIEDVREDALSRGLFRSGQRLVGEADVQRAFLTDEANARQQVAERLLELYSRGAELRTAGQADVANAALRAFGGLAAEPSEAFLAEQRRRQLALQAQLNDLLGRFRAAS